MGNTLNRCMIINETDVPIFIMTYSCSNTRYWSYRDWRQVPLHSELGDRSNTVQVTGLAGGRAVQVAVLYNIEESTGQVVRDIFYVAHGATLIIQGITDQSGVTYFVEDEGVEMHTKGQVTTISKEMAKLMTDNFKKKEGQLN